MLLLVVHWKKTQDVYRFRVPSCAISFVATLCLVESRLRLANDTHTHKTESLFETYLETILIVLVRSAGQFLTSAVVEIVQIVPNT